VQILAEEELGFNFGTRSEKRVQGTGDRGQGREERKTTKK
jgi:hypothetical protein